MTRHEALGILVDIRYPGFEFCIPDVSDFSLQVRCTGVCNVTGTPMTWSGRKWRLSTFMTKSELVQTAFMAVLAAVEHEAREAFRYKGASIFDPHYDIDKLLALRTQPDALSERA